MAIAAAVGMATWKKPDEPLHGILVPDGWYGWLRGACPHGVLEVFGGFLMPRTAFTCSHCGAPLTDFLEEYTEDQLVLETGAEMAPSAGFVRVSVAWTYREFVTARSPAHSYLSPDGDLRVFLPGDLLLRTTEVDHKVHPRASFGCCGLQPRGEANALCACGHAIGTVHGDLCWSPLVFRLLGDAVSEVVV